MKEQKVPCAAFLAAARLAWLRWWPEAAVTAARLPLLDSALRGSFVCAHSQIHVSLIRNVLIVQHTAS